MRLAQFLFLSLTTLASFIACSGDPAGDNDNGTGGAPAVGGDSSTGGSAAGGSGTGGATSDGGNASGGTSTGGNGMSGGAFASGGDGAGGQTPSGGEAGVGGELGSGGQPDGVGGGSAGPVPLFFDDFETATIGSDWTQNINGNGTFALDSAVFKNGSQSVKVAGSGFHTMLQLDAASFPTTATKIYVATWFRLGDTVDITQSNAHYIWLEAGAATNDQHEVRVGANIGLLQTNQYQNGEVDLREPGVVPAAGTWYCLEYSVDWSNHEMEVWFDGAPMQNISTTDWVQKDAQNGGLSPGSGLTNWAPVVESLRFGAELQGHDIWFDDIAVGTEQLGCN